MKHTKTFTLTSDLLTLYSTESNTASKTEIANGASFTVGSGRMALAGISLPEETLPPPLAGTHEGFPRSAVLVSAILSLYGTASDVENASKLMLFSPCFDDAGTLLPATESLMLDYEPLENEVGAKYSFDITAALRSLQYNATAKAFMLSVVGNGTVLLEGVGTANAPTLTLTYETSYGNKTFGETKTYPLTPHVHATVDLLRGNLMYSIDDFTIGKGGIPYVVRHAYNSAMSMKLFTKNHGIDTAHFSPMRLGYGWRMNLFRSMVKIDDYYVYTDDNGNEHPLHARYNGMYGNEAFLYSPSENTLSCTSFSCKFDERGRMIELYDGKGKKILCLEYNEHRIAKLTDSCGKEYHFTYSEYGYLERIYTDNIDDPIVRFGCRNGFLTYVWHGIELAVMEYEDGDKDLNLTPENACTVAHRDCSGCNVKMTTFSFEGERVKSVTISKDENGVVTTDTETYTSEEGKGNEFSEKENLLDSVDSGESAWHGTGDCTIASDGTISLVGSPSAPCFAYREIATPADASTRDNYILFASAKANSLPDRKRSDGHRSVFGIRAEIVYADGETEAYRKPFLTLTNDWQHAALHFSKRKYKAVEKLRIFCDYSNQANTACFGDLTLVCEGKSASTPFDMGARTVILQAGTRDEDFIDYQSRGECNCDDGADYIHVCYNNRASRRTRIIVSKNALPLPHDSRIIDAKLILYPAKIGTFGTIKDYNSLEIDYVGKPVEISLSDPFKNSDEVSIWLQHAFKEVDASFYKTGEYAPRLILRYVTDGKQTIPPRMTLLTDTTRAQLDIARGELKPMLPLASDSGIPFFAVHTATAVTELGKGFRHNFCETLTEGTKDIPYAYTDACGIAYPIKERFYYSPTPGVYEFVKKDDIFVRPDGTLWCGDKQITRETYTETGWVAKTELCGMDGIDVLEQRTEELMQAEEELDNYRAALEDYTIVKEADGSEVASVPPTDYESYCALLALAKETGNLLLTTGDALGYRGVLHSLDELENQKDLNENQSEALEYQQESLALYEESVVQQMDAAQLRMRMLAYENLSDSGGEAYVLADCSRCHVSATYHSDCESCAHDIATDSYRQPCQFSKESEGLSAEEKKKLQAIQFAECQIKQEKAQKALLCKQLINNKKQQANMNNQPNLYKTALELLKARKLALNEQIAEYKHISALHIEQLEKQAKVYFALESQVAKIKKALPVRYMVKDGVTKCFNKSGELCMISYRGGHILCAERDSENRIVRLIDEKERAYQLSYTDGLLSEIVSPGGERTVLRYEKELLQSVILDGGNELSLIYDANNRLTEIFSGRDNMKARLFYDEKGRISHISRYSAAHVAHGACTGNAHRCSELDIAYAENTVTLRTNGQITEQYRIIDANTSKIEHLTVASGLVIAAERQERRSQKEEITAKAERGCLGEPLSSFEFKDGECITHTKNDLGNPISEVSNWFPFCKGKDENGNDVTAMRRFARTYTYDAEGRAVTARTEVSEKLNDNTVNTHTEVQSFAYNADGAIVRKESYIEGEEYTNGKNITETLYDKHGNALRTVSYNTLDPSSKQYTKLERDEDGRILSAFDATGLHKVSYEYKDNGSDTVITEVKPNGARLSFGNTRSGHTAITLSTEAGEENSNTVRRTAGLVTELESGGRKINYRYDGKRRISAVELDGKPYIAYTYQDNVNENGRTVDHTVATLPDGTRMRSVYDKQGNLRRAERNGSNLLCIEYNAFGKPLTQHDPTAVTESKFTYDTFDRITSYTRTKNDAPLLSETYEYDGFGKLVTRRVTFGTKEIETEYAYRKDAKKKLDRVKVNDLTVRPVYDALGRTVGKVVENKTAKIAGEQVSYRKVGDHTTNVPAAIRFARRKECGYTTDGCLQYRYDAMGNITELREDGKLLAHYTYDAVGRITREDNRKMGRTTLFTYDNRGNILSREVAAYTAPDVSTDELDGERTLYEYEGEHLVRCGDEVFAYDAIGNPTTYRGKTASFANGRQMVALDGNTFTYDGSGRRMTKNGISFLYDSHGNLISESDGLTFLYDHAGLCGVIYGENTYIYRKDAQGNIIALLDTDGNIVVKYTYDAWGNHTVEDNTDCNLGTLNPFRYRGYYYDAETGLYYLQTRYYDPEIGRFVTIDDVAYLDPDTVGGLNLYAYCGNNPVMGVDPMGTASIPYLIAPSKLASATVKTLTAFFSSFEARIGIGIGFGVDISDNVTVEISRDTYIGIDDGSLITGNVITTELSVFGIGLGDSYDHLVEKGGKRVSSSGKPWDSPFEMVNYPDVKRGNIVSIGPFALSSSGDFLISISIGAHLGVGGHASLAFNVSEFLRRLFG